MTVLHSEVYEALRDIGLDEAKAMKAATALSKRDEDVAALKADLLLLKWMVGFNLAVCVAVLMRLLH